MRPLGRRLPARLRLTAAILAPFLLSACAQSPMSEQGKKVYTLYNIVLAIAVVIGLGVVGVILLTCVRYRMRPDDDGTLPPQTHGNTTFEVIWTAIPTIICLGLFGMSFATIRAIDKPNQRHAAVIEVRGYQWTWTFDYGTNTAGTRVLIRQGPDPKVTPELVVPVGETVHIEERSDNVLHSFFVPAFLFKRDVIPGKANGFDLTVSSPGIYGGQCAELCGTDHAKMTFTVRAVGRAEFDKWFQEFRPPRPKCEETDKAASSVTIQAIANKIEFAEKCVYVKAGGPTAVRFVNGGGFPHNVAFFRGPLPDSAKLVKRSEIIPSGAESFELPALPAGDDYSFFCQVHPQMEGRLVVK